LLLNPWPENCSVFERNIHITVTTPGDQIRGDKYGNPWLGTRAGRVDMPDLYGYLFEFLINSYNLPYNILTIFYISANIRILEVYQHGKGEKFPIADPGKIYPNYTPAQSYIVINKGYFTYDSIDYLYVPISIDKFKTFEGLHTHLIYAMVHYTFTIGAYILGDAHDLCQLTFNLDFSFDKGTPSWNSTGG